MNWLLVGGVGCKVGVASEELIANSELIEGAVEGVGCSRRSLFCEFWFGSSNSVRS